ncbi:MAG: M1 family aminopeptidase, partial [Candidatus Cloacimonadota bacterium]|nr:M1 family aminopeptidase [Candidatus Cloacimonadota bacterium]
GNTMITGNHTYETTIAHELSHHWFGNCLTPLTWADVWLSEGFAVYSEAVYMEAWQGYEEMLQYVVNHIQNYYKNWAASNGPQTIYDPEYNSYFTPATYEKPASVLHMLRRLLGDETFFSILQEYFQTYKNSNVVTTEFIDICEQVGQQDLQQFFQQWIFGSGLPFFDYTYFVGENSLKTFIQTTSNTETDFYVQVPIHIEYEDNYDSLLVESSPQITESTVTVSTSEYTSVEFDPNSWLLSRGSQYHGWEIADCYAADSEVLLTWSESWIEIDGVDVYRSNSPEGSFEKINLEPITDNFFLDSELQNEETYYYKIRAVKNSNYYTKYSEVRQATPMQFNMDQGILVIDETKDGNGNPGNPNDATVDEFYAACIDGEFTAYDYAEQGRPPLDLLGQYSAIVWHDDDLSEKNIEGSLNDLGCYLLAGGKLLLSGWKTANYFSDTFNQSFVQAGVTQLISDWDLIGVYSIDYPELSIDPNKLNPAFQGRLPYVVTFQTADFPIYHFDGIEGSEHQGKICAVKNDNCFLLGFPLYFFQEEEAVTFLQQVKEDWGIVKNTQAAIPDLMNLKAYPNPFNPTTTIEFSLAQQQKVRIDIYNIKGEKVKTLINSTLPADNHKVVWKGKDNNSRKVASGMYFYKMQTQGSSKTRKILLIK